MTHLFYGGRPGLRISDLMSRGEAMSFDSLGLHAFWVRKQYKLINTMPTMIKGPPIPIPSPRATFTIGLSMPVASVSLGPAVDDGKREERIEDTALGTRLDAVAPSIVVGVDDRVCATKELLEVGAKVMLEVVSVVAEGSDCRM